MVFSLHKKDVLGAVIIGEAVAWLLVVMLRVNAHNLPIPAGVADILSADGMVATLAIALPFLSVVGLIVASWLARIVSVVYQAAKFALVGALNTFIDLGVLNALILSTGIVEGAGFTLFATISFLAAHINSYAWNRWWVFDSTKGSAARQLGQFSAVGLVGLLLNVSTASIIVNVVGSPEGVAPEVWANVAKIVAIFVSLFWNFVGYKFWVFKRTAA